MSRKKQRKRRKKQNRKSGAKRTLGGARGQGLTDTPWDAFLLRWESPPVTCPMCGAELKEERSTFLATDPQGASSIMTGTGLFCERCTVLLLDADVFDRNAALAGFTDGYQVAGLVDLDAIPEDKDEVPLGEPDNPIPLVRFNSFTPGPP